MSKELEQQLIMSELSGNSTKAMLIRSTMITQQALQQQVDKKRAQVAEMKNEMA